MNLQQRWQEHMRKRQALQQMGLGKLDNHVQRNETGPFSYTVHKNKLKGIKDLNVRPENHKNHRNEHRK